MVRCCRCAPICSQFDNGRLKKPTNETLLWVAFVSFLSFALVQTVAALIAKSEAMLGDTAAMLVDALTYGFNLYAERRKNEDNENEINNTRDMSEIEMAAARKEANGIDHELTEREKLERHLQIRRRHLHLELIPPVMSVSFLLVVMGLVLHKAIQTLILDAHRSEQEQSDPNLILMMVFSILNLLLDLVNVACFARAKHLMGYNTSDVHQEEGTGRYNIIDSDDQLDADDEDIDENTASQPSESVESDGDDRVNLNMCSAYTKVWKPSFSLIHQRQCSHTLASTCSIAVIIAAIIAEMVDAVTPEVADATAAVIVSVVILSSLIPLFCGLVRTWRELRSLKLEEHALADSDSTEEVISFEGGVS
ncbi:hypothetical protein ACHAWF_013364 [Thalassiosira exigua]